MRNIDWKGVIAAILAAGLSITLIESVTGLIIHKEPITDKGAEVMIAVCVAMVAAISAYLASSNNRKP